MGKTVLAFDLYGTLLSTDSIASYLAGELKITEADAIAKTWRREQLQYTWRLNSMKHYEDFEAVTKKSFLHALAEHNVQVREEDIDSVMKAYNDLTPYDDVASALDKLEALSDVKCVVLSNGTRDMIVNSVNGAKGLATRAARFSQLISVDHVRSFKPAPEVYRYLKNCVQGSGLEGELCLVSSNPFDIVGARSVGLQAIWVDRAKRGWIDKLGHEPTSIIHDLGQLDQVISKA